MVSNKTVAIAVLASIYAASAGAGDLGLSGVGKATLTFGLETHKPPSWAGGGGGGGGGDDEPPTSGGTAPIYYGWMSPGLEDAWGWEGTTGYLGQGVTITVVDDFSSRTKYFGDLGEGRERLRHGEWTLKQAGMVAPGAEMVADDFYNGGAVQLDDQRFDILNLSYGYTAPLGRALETSIVEAAANGDAFIAKSAGNNYGAPVGYNLDGEKVDYLSLALINTVEIGTYSSTIFVGALDWNIVGTGDPDAASASYSSVAGPDQRVQQQFLVVGVEAGASAYSDGTGLAGTSFAAPIVAGYGAVLSSKFTTASPTQVAQRLLETAHDDFKDYNPTRHGQGEADIGAAVAPGWIQ